MSDAASDAVRPIDHGALEVARESVTMALYQSLSLLAVLLATPSPGAQDTRVQVAGAVFLTSVGLLAAHHVAFRMSSRLVNSGLLTPESRRLLAAQALGGLPVAVLAALPPLLFGVDPGTVVSELLLVGLVGTVGYRSVRRALSAARSLAYVGVLMAAVLAVIALKLAVGH